MKKRPEFWPLSKDYFYNSYHWLNIENLTPRLGSLLCSRCKLCFMLFVSGLAFQVLNPALLVTCKITLPTYNLRCLWDNILYATTESLDQIHCLWSTDNISINKYHKKTINCPCNSTLELRIFSILRLCSRNFFLFPDFPVFHFPRLSIS